MFCTDSQSEVKPESTKGRANTRNVNSPVNNALTGYHLFNYNKQGQTSSYELHDADGNLIRSVEEG